MQSYALRKHLPDPTITSSIYKNCSSNSVIFTATLTLTSGCSEAPLKMAEASVTTAPILSSLSLADCSAIWRYSWSRATLPFSVNLSLLAVCFTREMTSFLFFSMEESFSSKRCFYLKVKTRNMIDNGSIYIIHNVNGRLITGLVWYIYIYIFNNCWIYESAIHE